MFIDLSPEVLEDLNLEYTNENKILVLQNTKYFNRIHELYAVTHQIPFCYYNEQGILTRYLPPPPPRILTKILPLNIIDDHWKNLVAHMSSCCITPVGRSISPYESDWQIINPVLELIQGSHYAVAYRTFYNKAFLLQEQVCLNHKGLIYPIRLMLEIICDSHMKQKDSRDLDYLVPRQILFTLNKCLPQISIRRMRFS